MLALRRALLLLTDVGFLFYWILAFTHAVPPEWLYKDATHPIIAAWNVSFLPLDLIVSATGLASIATARACPGSSRAFLLVSLVATSISGLQALSFWALRGDFELSWWLANGFLFAWPIPFLAHAIWTAEPRASLRPA